MINTRLLIAAIIAVSVVGCGPTPSHHGGACKDPVLPGDLVITEVFADWRAAAAGTSTDTGEEWFEIYNAADHPLDLQGLAITHSRPDGSMAQSHTMRSLVIAPEQFLTLGNATQALVPPHVGYGYSTDLGELYNTGGGKLVLSCGDTEIDSAGYDAVKEGHSRELTAAEFPDYTVNDDQANWCQSDASEFTTGNFGTPGSDNDCTPFVLGQCNDFGFNRDAVLPAPGDLVITEAMPSPTRVPDATGEWFEVHVMSDCDLNGVGLDRVADSYPPDVIASPDCIHVTAGTDIVFARTQDTTANGGLPAAAVLGTFRFALIAGAPGAPGDIEILAGSTVVDAVSWTHATDGTSLQLDPDLIDPIENDMESGFCAAVTPYGLGDLGTPGTANSQCTLLPPAGMCDDGGTVRAIVKPAAGQLVISEVLANPMGSEDTKREWFEVTNTGTTAFDLNELTLQGKTGSPNVIQSAPCLTIAAGGYALFARSNDPAQNGMLPAVDATFGFTLIDTAGTVSVLDGANVLDTVSWASVTSGVAKALGSNHLTTTDNDNAASFCPATIPYGDGTSLGTPRAPNASCP